MPSAPGVQRTSVAIKPRAAAITVRGACVAQSRRNWLPASPAIQRARADSPTPKAVFIVGPTNNLTNSNLADAEKMAVQAEAAGMDVHRVFFPDATWDERAGQYPGRQSRRLHGSRLRLAEPVHSQADREPPGRHGAQQPTTGSADNEYTYYGANLIREQIHLAPNAVVILVHGCYTAGNGEPGNTIPSEDLARERVDNFASGFLGAGARAVFAFGWNQKLNFMNALATSNSTMDQLFMTTAGGSPAGFVGWQDHRFESQRTPGATNHLDPHRNYGFYRAVTGDLSMTAADWRSGAAVDPPPPPPPRRRHLLPLRPGIQWTHRRSPSSAPRPCRRVYCRREIPQRRRSTRTATGSTTSSCFEHTVIARGVSRRDSHE